jgi:hypothetical protein
MAEQITGFLSDSEIDGQGVEAQRLAKQDAATKRIFPAFARSKDNRARLLNALLGIQAGQAAAQQSVALGDPFGAAIAGFAAQAGAPTAERIAAQREAEAAQQQMAVFESQPVESISPALVEKFPELQGLPLGVVSKLAPALQRSESLEQQLMIAMRKMGLDANSNERDRITRELLDIQDELGGMKGLMGKASNPKRIAELEAREKELRAILRGKPAPKSEQGQASKDSGVKELTSPESVREAWRNGVITREQARLRIQELKSGKR